MTAPVFVDTNIFVYARDTSEPAKQPTAADWIERLWRDQTGRTSVQVLSEYFVTVTRKLSPGISRDDAWDDVEALLTWRPQPIDDDVLRRGHEVMRRYRISWWDALIVAAAQLQGALVLLSEDLSHGTEYGGVTVRNPFIFGIAELHATYDTLPPPRSPRRRGRPARPS